MRGDIPSGLARIVHHMLAKKPEHRYQSPSELLAELRKLAGEAAHEGWGEGAEHWSIADWIASADTRSQAATELSRLMHDSTKLEHRTSIAALTSRRWWSPLCWSASGWASLTRPRSFLAGPPVTTVETRDSALAQVFHAKMAPSEAAWKAVWEKFPNADTYIHDLAREGLVRYYLFLTQDYAKALPYLQRLADSADAAPADSPLQGVRLRGPVRREPAARPPASRQRSGLAAHARHDERPAPHRRADVRAPPKRLALDRLVRALLPPVLAADSLPLAASRAPLRGLPVTTFRLETAPTPPIRGSPKTYRNKWTCVYLSAARCDSFLFTSSILVNTSSRHGETHERRRRTNCAPPSPHPASPTSRPCPRKSTTTGRWSSTTSTGKRSFPTTTTSPNPNTATSGPNSTPPRRPRLTPLIPLSRAAEARRSEVRPSDPFLSVSSV